MFANTLPARRRRVAAVRPGDQDFDRVIGAGMIEWAADLTGGLLVIPKFVRGEELAHTVLTAGAPVLAAGEAEIVGIVGNYLLLELNRHSGHYRPDAARPHPGLRAFAAADIRRL